MAEATAATTATASSENDGPLAALTRASSKNDILSSLVDLGMAIKARTVTLSKATLLDCCRQKRAGDAAEGWSEDLAAALGDALRSFDASGKVVATPPASTAVGFRMGRKMASGACHVRQDSSLEMDQVAF